MQWRSSGVESNPTALESGAFDATWSFEVYVRQRLDGLLRHAMTLTGDGDEAQDVVQAVLERAMRRWDQIRAMDAPEGYVRRMMINEAISRKRRAARLFLRSVDEDRPAPDATAGVVDRAELVTRIRALPPRQRVAIALRYFHDLNDAQIAAEMGCTESTVRGYVLRALRTLRLELDLEDR